MPAKAHILEMVQKLDEANYEEIAHEIDFVAGIRKLKTRLPAEKASRWKKC